MYIAVVVILSILSISHDNTKSYIHMIDACINVTCYIEHDIKLNAYHIISISHCSLLTNQERLNELRQDFAREKGRLEEERTRVKQERDMLRVEEQKLESLALAVKERSQEMQDMVSVCILGAFVQY